MCKQIGPTNWSIATHIQVRVLVLLALGVLACVLSSTLPPYTSLSVWQRDADQAMRTSIHIEHTTVMYQVSQHIQGLYEKVTRDVQLGTNYTLSALRGDIPVNSYYQTYFGDSTVDARTAPRDFDGRPLFTTTFKLGVQTAADVYNLTHVNETSLYDNIARWIYKANGALYGKLMLGLSHGLLRRYPHSHVNADYLTSSVYCNGNPIGYSPVCRPWYTQARDNPVRGAVTFSGAYVDAATSQSVMSASQAIYYPSPNVLWGVHNIDCNMSTWDLLVTQTKISPHGYVFLMDRTGNILSHPNVNRVTWPLGINIDVFRVESVVPTTLWNTILADSGVANEQVRSYPTSEWSIYSLYLTQAQQLLIAKVPVGDIVTPGAQLRTNLDTIVRTSTIVIAVVVVVVGLLAFACQFIGTRYFTRPIRDVTFMMQQLTEQNLDVVRGIRAPVSAELRVLHNSLHNVCMIISVANDAYASGDPLVALAQYRVAATLMQQCKNERGLAICRNNMANVYKFQQRYADAQELYVQALAVARKCVEDSTSKAQGLAAGATDQLMADRITCAKRCMNLGVLYKDIGNQTEALRLFEESLQFHRSADDSVGIARVSGNLGQLYIELRRLVDARQVLHQALETLQHTAQRDTLAQQHVYFNLALLAEAEHQWEAATQYAERLVFESPTLDLPLRRPLLEKLSIWYKRTGNERARQEVVQLLEAMDLKHVVFVLDVSGSMAGSRILDCRHGIRQVVQHVGRHDRLSLVTFSAQCEAVFANRTRANDQQRIDYDIQHRTVCQSSTNLYGALVRAMHEVDQAMQTDRLLHRGQVKQWIVLFTDGDDTVNAFTPNQVAELIRTHRKTKPAFHLVVITAGEISAQTTANLRQILDACGEGHGLLIPVDTRHIQEAFTRVERMMVTGQVNVEVM